MKNLKESEEKLKNKIYSIFIESRNDSTSDRRQVYYPQLCEQIYKWCRDYSFFNTDKIGVEISEVTNKFFKKNSNLKIPQNADEFIKVICTSLKREKIANYYKFDEKEKIHIPKDKNSKYNKVEKEIIKMKERYSENVLTQDDYSLCISKWFKNQMEYNEIKNAKKVVSLFYTNKDDDKESDIINYSAISFSSLPISNDPLYIQISDSIKGIIKESIKKVLEQKKITRDCKKALYTLHCINLLEDVEWLSPVLDQKVINACKKEEEKPTQYDIYQEFHQEAKDKEKAGISATTLLKEFKNDLKKYLKENYPEISL